MLSSIPLFFGIIVGGSILHFTKPPGCANMEEPDYLSCTESEQVHTCRYEPKDHDSNNYVSTVRLLLWDWQSTSLSELFSEAGPLTTTTRLPTWYDLFVGCLCVFTSLRPSFSSSWSPCGECCSHTQVVSCSEMRVSYPISGCYSIQLVVFQR